MGGSLLSGGRYFRDLLAATKNGRYFRGVATFGGSLLSELYGKNMFNQTNQHDHDQLYRKRLKYDNHASCKDHGKKFRQSLIESNAVPLVGPDDETQDDSQTESPTPKTNSAGAEASLASVMDDKGESHSLSEKSQSFNYDSWVKEQLVKTKKIASKKTVDSDLGSP